MVNDVIRELCRHSSADGKCNYITAQTGFTLWDLVSYDGKHNEANGENNADGPDYNFSWNCGAEGPSRKKAVPEPEKEPGEECTVPSPYRPGHAVPAGGG